MGYRGFARNSCLGRQQQTQGYDCVQEGHPRRHFGLGHKQVGEWGHLMKGCQGGHHYGLVQNCPTVCYSFSQQKDDVYKGYCKLWCSHAPPSGSLSWNTLTTLFLVIVPGASLQLCLDHSLKPSTVQSSPPTAATLLCLSSVFSCGI